MAEFITVSKNVLIMLVYITIGYTLVKSGKAKSEDAKGFSAFLIYVCCPCMLISSFVQMKFSMVNFRKTMCFLGVTFLIQLLFFILLYLIFRKKYEDAKYRIMSLCGTLGNVGFFGLPIVSSLFPEESVVPCYSTIYVVSMNLLVFTVGVYLITTSRKYISGDMLPPLSISCLK